MSETDPLPMTGLAQLYRRDVPDLPAGPGDRDLLQVFRCPFHAHGPGRYGLELHLRWRRPWEVGEVLTTPPHPLVVGSGGFVPEPCALHPEQVVTYPFADLLPEELCARIDAWEEALEEGAEPSAGGSTTEPLGYQHTLAPRRTHIPDHVTVRPRTLTRGIAPFRGRLGRGDQGCVRGGWRRSGVGCR
ncbi:hypothetical protein [Streptomyces sp. enrichment culture]|uniref:hypothetical protein n=1 Tax=Streptomyces sp. enrichment culture TaxID=1795815 RepID=UPI003F5563DB